MTFAELVAAILHEQDSVTHYNEEGVEGPMRLHQQYRAEAIERLREWVAEAVAAERERCAKRVADNADYRAMEATDPDATARVRRDQHFAAAVLWEAAADIRTRAGEGEQVPMSDNPNCET